MEYHRHQSKTCWSRQATRLATVELIYSMYPLVRRKIQKSWGCLNGNMQKCRSQSATVQDLWQYSTKHVAQPTKSVAFRPMKLDGGHQWCHRLRSSSFFLIIAWFWKSRDPLATAFVRIASIIAHRSTVLFRFLCAAPEKIANTNDGRIDAPCIAKRNYNRSSDFFTVGITATATATSTVDSTTDHRASLGEYDCIRVILM